MKLLILGSQSPRRREILNYFSLPFQQVHPSFDEESVPFEGNAGTYVCCLSKGKADSLAPYFSEEVILTADTIVFREGKIYGKPKNEQEAFQTLLELEGKWHTVLTGISVRQKDKEFQCFEETHVLFNSLKEDQIRHYHTKLHWEDKAGGYDIRMGSGLIVNKINGCYYNVIGLPINSVRKMLLEFGIELWNYLQ